MPVLRYFPWLCLLLALPLLGACNTPEVAVPATPAPATVVPYIPMDQLPGAGTVTTLGYLLVRDTGAILVSAASVVGATPNPLGDPADAIWCGELAALKLTGALSGTGAARAAIVLARGTLVGPGAYGPGGVYRRELRNVDITVVVPEETNVAALMDRSSYYAGRVVRVNGGMIAREGSTVLVDQIGSGGVPAPQSRQLKLRILQRDTALLDVLHPAAGEGVRYGRVQVEGYWQSGALIALAIRPLDGR